MATSRMLASADIINNLIKMLPAPIKAAEAPECLVPRETVGRLRIKALDATLPFLQSVVARIRMEQEKYSGTYFGEMNQRQAFAVKSISQLRHSIEKDFDRKRIDQARDVLNEIEYYKQLETATSERICVDRERTLEIFRLLALEDTCIADPYIGEYLKRKIHFSCDPPSDIEISALRTMLAILQAARD